MSRNLSLNYWLANRSKLTGNGTRGARTGIVIAICGVTIAVMIMEFTLCIVLGFKHQIRDKIAGFEAGISVGPRYLDSSGITDDTIRMSPQWQNLIAAAAPGAEISLSVQQPAILKTTDNFAAIILNASDPDSSAGHKSRMVTQGVWPDFGSDSATNKIVISAEIANQLGLRVSDKVDASFFVDNNIKSRRYSIAAIYQSNIADYDQTVGFASIKSLRRVAGIDSLTGSQIDINGIALDSIPVVSERLGNLMLQEYYSGRNLFIYPIDSILHKGAMYFNWLSLLDTNVVVIFILMLCVAGFTLVSSLFLIVLDRISLIGILRTLGASKGRIRSIFRIMALRLAGTGMIIGNLLGLGLMFLQYHFGIVKLDPKMYYIDTVPVEFSIMGLLLLNAGVAVAAWLILIIPSAAASRIDPASTMRYD